MREFKCSETKRAKAKQYYYDHKEAVLKQKKQEYAENPAKRKAANRRYYLTSRYNWAKHLMLRYGLPLEEWDNLLIEQTGRCASCGRALSAHNKDVSGVCVDHNHTTGEVRSLLCCGCNTALGHLEEDPVKVEALLSYIERWN